MGYGHPLRILHLGVTWFILHVIAIALARLWKMISWVGKEKSRGREPNNKAIVFSGNPRGASLRYQ